VVSDTILSMFRQNSSTFQFHLFLAKKKIGEEILRKTDKTSLVDLFVEGSSLHIFRATEPSLHLRVPLGPGIYSESVCEKNISHCTQTWWGSKGQLAKIVMSSGVF
jgi:hypothetical protein